MSSFPSPNPVTAAARRSRLSLHVFMVLIAAACTTLFFELAVQLSARLRRETFHQYRLLSEEATGRMNDDLQKRVIAEATSHGLWGGTSLSDDHLFLFQASEDGAGLKLLSRQDRKTLVKLGDDVESFFRATVGKVFFESAMGSRSSLELLDKGKSLLALSPAPTDGRAVIPDANEGRIILRQSLAAPFDQFEVVFKAVRIPIAKSGADARALVGMLLLLLPSGLGVLYLLALKQVDVAEERSRFVSEVSHELRTPLTSIRMYSEMLRDGMVQGEEKKREYAALIASESERLSNLVGDLLDLSRFARGLRRLNMQVEKVCDLVELVTSRVQGMTQQRGFDLVVAGEYPQETLIKVDRDAFLRVCINLADNSLRYSSGATERKIVFSVAIEAKFVSFAFRDFGPGFAPKARISFRRPQASVPGGTGIGLALVREAVKRMKGNLRLKNQQIGALVQVNFPRHKRLES